MRINHGRRIVAAQAAVLILFVLAVMAHTATLSSSFVIPAALEIHLTDPVDRPRLLEHQDERVQYEWIVRIGTNDWPLELRVGILPNGETLRAFPSLHYQFEKVDVGAAWSPLEAYCPASVPTILPSPAWTDYALRVSVEPGQLDTEAYDVVLRVSVESRSGRVEWVDLSLSTLLSAFLSSAQSTGTQSASASPA